MVAASETKEEEGEHIQAVTEPPGPAASAAHAAPAARASGLSIALHVPLSVVVVLVAVISVAIAVALTRDDDGGGGASTLTVATDGVQERRASAMPTPSPTTPSSSPTVPPSELSIVWQPEDFQSEDPFVAAPVTPWETTGSGGLTLAIVNAMDEEWQALFGIVVQEWDSGVPDALTLLTTRVTPDSACVTEFGVFKLCNGDYGGTGWRGVVVHVMDDDDDFVVAAVGKLNDFYLPDSDADDQAFRRYTLCHEMGHGFGLPHTDEDFHNADLGNCMDYTNNPEVNQSPDASNFALLKEIYGEVSPGRALAGRDRGVSTGTGALSRTLLEGMNDFALGGDGSAGWELLQKTAFGSSHQKSVGHGLSVRVRLLSAQI